MMSSWFPPGWGNGHAATRTRSTFRSLCWKLGALRSNPRCKNARFICAGRLSAAFIFCQVAAERRPRGCVFHGTPRTSGPGIFLSPGFLSLTLVQIKLPNGPSGVSRLFGFAHHFLEFFLPQICDVLLPFHSLP